MKRILFLSALDFKERSIQVIRKTPEAFANNAWKVDYIVSRDNSKHGPYFYEKTFNPENVNVTRFQMPLSRLRNMLPAGLFQVVVAKIALCLTVLKLALIASRKLKNNYYDVIYGYEIHGVLAIRVLKLFGRIKNVKTVSRFQGTWITNYILNKRYLKLLLNQDALMAMRFKPDLCIMTDDGTRGNYFFEKRDHIKNFHFWINGVDEQLLPEDEYAEIEKKYREGNKFLFLSVCRLESWKRVDRIIETVSVLVNKKGFRDLKYLIIGDGPEKQNLMKMVKSENLSSYVDFIGAVVQEEVKKYLNAADIFFSTYDLSNVGNPLLEAIKANKIIFTLNNGETARWIKHKKNGFIFEVDDRLYENMAGEAINVLNDPVLRKEIIDNVQIQSGVKIWSWKERFNAELKEVENLLEEKR